MKKVKKFKWSSLQTLFFEKHDQFEPQTKNNQTYSILITKSEGCNTLESISFSGR